MTLQAETLPAPRAAPASGPGPVLHVVASGGLYGLERMLAGLLPSLVNAGCDAALASMAPPGTPGGALGELVSSLGVPVHYPATPGRVSLRGLARLDATLRRCRPAVVHLHGYKAIILAGPLALARRIPTVATFHTEVLKTPGFTLHKRLEIQVVKRLKGMAAVSEPIRRELEARGVEPGRIHVIPNGILDPLGERAGGEGRSWAEPEEPVLVFMGRLVEGKNVDLLIDSVAALRAGFPGLRLLVAGEGPLRESLEARAAARGVAGAVRFLGFIADVHPLLAGATCFVLPSRAEGMPISLLESMALGVPTVATRVGSIPDVVRHGEEALLVEPDDPAALTDSLRRLLGDADLRRRIGRGGRARFAREFTAERMAARYTAFYRSVTDREKD